MEKKEIINNLDGCLDEIRKGICDMLNMMPEPGTDIGIPDECMYDRLPEPAGVSPVYDDAYIKKLGDAVRKASAAAYITHMLYGVTGIKSWPFIDFRHEPVVCLKNFGKARAKNTDWYPYTMTGIYSGTHASAVSVMNGAIWRKLHVWSCMTPDSPY